MNKKTFSLMTMLLSWSFSFLAHAENAPSIGLGMGWSHSQYKGYGNDYYPLPNITFDNDTFFIDNFTAGAYLYHNDVHELSVALTYLPLEFKPKHSDDLQMKQLNKRHSTLLAQVEYTRSTNIGNFTASIAADVLDESNSVIINADYTTLLTFGQLFIVPEVGFNWANKKHNNYYYGISESESQRSGLAAYSAKSTFTPYISVTGYYTINQHFTTYLGARVDRLTGDVKKSPMIAHSTIPSVFAGINYTF